MSDPAPPTASGVRPPLFYFGTGAICALIILGIRLALASRVGYCGWRDACFYETLAQQLAHHHGFVVPFVWDYQVGDINLPNPALEYWRPGMSLLLASPAVFGDRVTLMSAAILDTLATLLLSLSAAWLAWRTLSDRLATLLAFLLCLSLAPLWTMPLTPDSALFYAVAVAWFLVLITVERANLAVEVIGLAMAGIAYLIRNDAIVLGVVLVVILARRLSNARNDGRPAEVGRAVALCIGFVLALVPTHVLLYAVGGHPFNSAIDRVMFLGNMDDFRRYGSVVDFTSWSSAGVAALVKMRLNALFATLRATLLLCSQFPTLLALVGAVLVATRRRREYGDRFLGPAVFLVVLAGSYILVLPVIADHAVPRSAVALLPAFAVLAVIGAREVVRSATIATAAVGIAALFSAIHGLSEARGLIGNFHQLDAQYKAEAELVRRDARPGQPVIAMVVDPAPFTATTGIPSVPLPSNGIAATEQAIARYGVTAVVADEWQGGRALVAALHGAKVDAVPETTDIVIGLPAARAAAD